MHWGVAWTRAALALLVAAGRWPLCVVSGGSAADPRTPPALPGMPPPFLGTAVVGSGGLTAAIDAYGNVVDLRTGPAGRALIENPAARQAAGSVPADTGIVPRVSVGGGPAMPLWRADSVSQRYLPGTNVVRTVGAVRAPCETVVTGGAGERLALVVAVDPPTATRAVPVLGVDVEAARLRAATANAARDPGLRDRRAGRKGRRDRPAGDG